MREKSSVTVICVANLVYLWKWLDISQNRDLGFSFCKDMVFGYSYISIFMPCTWQFSQSGINLLPIWIWTTILSGFLRDHPLTEIKKSKMRNHGCKPYHFVCYWVDFSMGGGHGLIKRFGCNYRGGKVGLRKSLGHNYCWKLSLSSATLSKCE